MFSTLKTWQPAAREPVHAIATLLPWLLIALALSIPPALAQTDSLVQADSLSQEASRLYEQGRYAEAVPKAREALALREQAFGPNYPDVATSLNNLGVLLKAAADYNGAMPLLERALKIREETLGPNHTDVAESLSNLAGLLQATGDYAAARPLYERALRIFEAALGLTHPRVAAGLNGLAHLLLLTGDYTAARPLFERALKIREQALGLNHPEVATILNNLAGLLGKSGDHAAARPLYERALRIKEQTLGPNHPDVATILNNLAGLLQRTGDFAGARALYERALRIRQQGLGPAHPDVAASLNNVATLLESIRDYAAAMPLYEQALRIKEQALGPTHPDVALSLDNLAGLLQRIRDYGRARRLYERALTIREKALGPTHRDVALSLNNLAVLLQATGDHTAAKSLIERALTIREQALGPSHTDVAESLANFAIMEWEAGRLQEAVPKLARAVEITRAHTAHVLVGLSNRQKLAFLETTAELTDAVLSLPPGLMPNAGAYRVVLDRKNLLFRTLAAERSLAEASSSPEVAALLQEYAAVRRQLAGLMINGPVSQDLTQYQPRVASLTQRLETIEAELSRASSAFRQSQTEGTAGPAEICAAVPVDATLIELFWYKRYVVPAAPGGSRTWTRRYVAFALRGGVCNDPVRVDLGPAGPIEEDVRRFRDALSRDSADLTARELRTRYRTALAARLHAKLFPPALQQAIAGKPRLLIAPDGALALLPFALLSGEEGREFLLETRAIGYLPSGRDLLRTGGPSSGATSLLAVGAPAFDLVPVQTGQAATLRAGCGTEDEPFTPLPGTAAELKAIAEVYQTAQPTKTATLLEGPQATKAALLEQASRAGVLHLASHAYFAGEECAPAGLTSAPERTGGDVPLFLGHNPLLLAGIALAGANERDKANGILTALEVTALDLRGTELVVLSACDTGLGTTARGQELLGLRWAFAYAGAKNLVTSLWSVPDAETATLMTHFYRGLWVKGLSVPEALRAAQLEMLKAARARGDSAPHTWGAFVSSGHPN